ncbi:hypothetical protein [Nocardioides sp.]|uniref:hypothetical protein n=1 Tax=Nocardioides sp. TaxID=35761 RepID=UPI0035AF4094
MSSRSQPPTATDDAKQRLRRYEWLVALLALVLLTLLYLFLPDRSASDLWEASLPNAIAALAIFFVILAYNQYLRRGPLEDVQELLDRQTQDIREAISPLGGVTAFYPDWSTISEADWRSLLESAHRIDIVMNFSSSFLDRNNASIGAAAKAGATINLYLPDPGDPGDPVVSDSERERLSDLARAYDINVPTLQERIAGSVKMARSLATDPARVSVRFYPRLMYAAVRLDQQTLVLSHYDQFPTLNAKACAIVLDVGASDVLKAYWANQFATFDAQGEQTTHDLDRLVAHFYHS